MLDLTCSSAAAPRRRVGRRRPKRSEDAARPAASGPTVDSSDVHARAVGRGGVLAALRSPPPRPTALAWRRHYQSGATNHSSGLQGGVATVARSVAPEGRPIVARGEAQRNPWNGPLGEGP